jgi:hypothetical protein
MINEIIKILRAPSLYPGKASLMAGTFAALCMFTAPWSTLIGVGFLVSALTFGVLNIRNILYSGYTANRDSNYKIDAHNCGGRSGRDYFHYAKSFIDLPSWRHPIIFGQALKCATKRTEALANNEIAPLKVVPTIKKFGFY